MIWPFASVLLGALGAVLIWRGVRRQQEREDRQHDEDSGAILRP